MELKEKDLIALKVAHMSINVSCKENKNIWDAFKLGREYQRLEEKEACKDVKLEDKK